MTQGNEFELQGGAPAHPEREQGTEGGQKREHAEVGMLGRKKRYTCAAVLTFEQARAVQIEPESLGLGFTRWMHHLRPRSNQTTG